MELSKKEKKVSNPSENSKKGPTLKIKHNPFKVSKHSKIKIEPVNKHKIKSIKYEDSSDEEHAKFKENTSPSPKIKQEQVYPPKPKLNECLNLMTFNQMGKTQFINQTLFQRVYTKKPLYPREILVKKVSEDSNCFYRCLSFFFESNDENFNNYRQRLFGYSNEHFVNYSEYKMKILGKKVNIKEYIPKMQEENFFACDFEFSLTSLIFDLNIALYVQSNGIYEFLRIFSDNSNFNRDLMILVFYNNIHFDLIYSCDKEDLIFSTNRKNTNYFPKYDYDKREFLLKSFNCNTISRNYIKYSCDRNAPDKYNEMSIYLAKKEKQPDGYNYPERLYLIPDLVKREKGKEKFRRLVKKYRLNSERRLEHVVVLKTKEKDWRRIPFQNEIPRILDDLHYKTNHRGINYLREELIKAKWWWKGMLKSIDEFIRECPICNVKKEHPPSSPKDFESKFGGIYLADIWTLDEKISKQTGINFILSIVDYFTKFAWSYPLFTSSSQEIMSFIGQFISLYGKPGIFQANFGVNFSTKTLSQFCREYGIQFLKANSKKRKIRKIYDEAHKDIKMNITNDFFGDRDNFNLNVSINNAVAIHNQTKNELTKFTPSFLKDNKDSNITIEAIENVRKSMKRKSLKIKEEFDRKEKEENKCVKEEDGGEFEEELEEIDEDEDYEDEDDNGDEEDEDRLFLRLARMGYSEKRQKHNNEEYYGDRDSEIDAF